ncbi:hypothetical protein V6N13_057382 [Hibiscus sabdariffa]
MQIKFYSVYGDNGLEPIRFNEFMMNGEEDWDARKVRQVFNDYDAKAILECPINPISEDLQLRGLHTAESAEACAFKEGVRMAIENGWTHVVFEGDSAIVVSRLDRRELDRSHTAAHLRSTVSLLVDHPGFAFVFVRRAINRAAHGLAQWAINENVSFRFDLEIPLCIEHFVIEDAIFS